MLAANTNERVVQSREDKTMVDGRSVRSDRGDSNDIKSPSSSSKHESVNGTSASNPINHMDFVQPRREHLFVLPDFITRWVIENMLRRKDEKNMTIFLVGMNILTTSVPAAAALFYLEAVSSTTTRTLVILGCIYVAAHLKTYGRSFILALHNNSHTSIFNTQCRGFFDFIWNTVLGVFFGIPPGLYYPHHVKMHHAGGNVAPHDTSSTMDFHRGSQWAQLYYILRFLTLGSYDFLSLLLRQKKYSLFYQSFVGTVVYGVLMVSSFLHFPIATIFVLWLPMIIISTFMMAGNFKEHILVDPDEPENNYKSTCTCINSPHNALTFNSGYHIEHHEEPGMPWYGLPDVFLRNLDKHAKNDSFIFSGIGQMEVGNLVLAGKFEELADAYVNIGQPKRSREELIIEIKRRLVPTQVIGKNKII